MPPVSDSQETQRRDSRSPARGGSELVRVSPFRLKGWNAALLQHPDVTVYHTANWARVLTEACGYRAMYHARLEYEQPVAVLPLMEVRRRLTGRRGVCLPLTDVCAPLYRSDWERNAIWDTTRRNAREKGWRFAEIRGGPQPAPGIMPSGQVLQHRVMLDAVPQKVFEALPSNTRRHINRACAKRLRVRILQSTTALNEFYQLHCITRRRHGLPPLTDAFFRAIYTNMISPDLGFIALTYHEHRAIAGAICFRFGPHLVAHFGASHHDFHALSPSHLTLWRLMEWGCLHGYSSFDMGSTRLQNSDLLRFKDGWTRHRQIIPYYKYDLAQDRFVEAQGNSEYARTLLRRMPVAVLRTAGTLLYRHWM